MTPAPSRQREDSDQLSEKEVMTPVSRIFRSVDPAHLLEVLWSTNMNSRRRSQTTFTGRSENGVISHMKSLVTWPADGHRRLDIRGSPSVSVSDMQVSQYSSAHRSLTL